MTCRLDLSKPLVVYGLTGGPLHNGHLASYFYLQSLGYEVVVVPAIGHEFKPEAIATYLNRRKMCANVVGDKMLPVEEWVLDKELDNEPEPTLDQIRAALAKRGRSVMAIDVLRKLREVFDILRLEGDPPQLVIKFAIGPDVDVETWTGIELIRAEFGDPFVRLPEVPGIRSTLIRENIAAGVPWEHMVPPGSAEVVKAERMYGYKG